MTNTVYDADPAWSPKGDQIAFRRRDRTGDRKNSDVYVIDADGKSEAKPLADDPNADEQNPSWSPSGDQIAYKSNAMTAAWPGSATRSSLGDEQQRRPSASAVDQRRSTARLPNRAELEQPLTWSPPTRQPRPLAQS